MGTGRQIAEYALGAYDVKGGYIYGKVGQVWTEAAQAQMEKEKAGDPDYAESIKYGRQWIGHRVWDCSGLTMKGAQQAGVSIHHGSNSTYLYDCDHKGKLTDGMALPVGAFVFVYKNGKRTHIGVVTGENEVTEASCARLGVIKSKIYQDKWDEWGLCKGVEFDFIPGEDPDYRPTLRKGDSGTYVTLMQELLIQRGYEMPKYGADGKFGNETLTALKAFQRAEGLAPDGVCGEKTWTALEGSEPEKRYTATVPHLTLKQAEAIRATYPETEITEE